MPNSWKLKPEIFRSGGSNSNPFLILGTNVREFCSNLRVLTQKGVIDLSTEEIISILSRELKIRMQKWFISNDSNVNCVFEDLEIKFTNEGIALEGFYLEINEFTQLLSKWIKYSSVNTNPISVHLSQHPVGVLYHKLNKLMINDPLTKEDMKVIIDNLSSIKLKAMEKRNADGTVAENLTKGKSVRIKFRRTDIDRKDNVIFEKSSNLNSYEFTLLLERLYGEHSKLIKNFPEKNVTILMNDIKNLIDN